MNKKILSIFALIMAISILGVSCADNNTTKPEDQKPATLTAEEQKEILKAIGTLSIPKAAGSGNFDFVFDENKTVTASSSTYTVEVVAVSADPGASAKANYVDIIPVIKAKDFSSVKTVTINKDAATYQKVDGSSDLKVNVIIPFTKGETKGIIVLQLSGDHTSNDLTFGAKEVTANDVQAALRTLGNLAINTEGDVVDFNTGTISTTTFTVTHDNSSGQADGSYDTITESLEAKLSDLATALKAKGVILKTATVTTFAGSGADASTTISIEADTDYALATAITSGTITIKITLTTSNNSWA